MEFSVYDCEDKPLVWRGQTYTLIAAPNGTVTINLPPGCYRVNAVWSYYQVGNVFYGNHFTDSALIVIGCNENKCIKLYNPIIHRCGIVFSRAILDTLNQVNARIAQTPPPDVTTLIAIRDQLTPVANILPTIDTAMLAVAGLIGYGENATALKAQVDTDEANIIEMNKFTNLATGVEDKCCI